MSQILEFYLQIVPDNRGRTLSFIWQQDYQWLEQTHDYIQWLFPLPERSRFNPNAPLLIATDIDQFKANPQAQQNLIFSLSLMLRFYGLKIENSGSSPVKITIDPASFPDRKQQWLHWGNHNHLRISRILRSLSLLGLEEYAQGFFQCLEQIYRIEKGSITRLTFSYWQEAANRKPEVNLP